MATRQADVKEIQRIHSLLQNSTYNDGKEHSYNKKLQIKNEF